MSDIKLFRISETAAEQLDATSATLEKHLQQRIEQHMPTLLGVRFLASEFPTGPVHRGRIDSLGLDENGCPVIIEYKRHSNENVINQGLFYLDWLLDHMADFELLVLKTLGQDAADSIQRDSPRLLCIAGDFTRYDIHAVQQIERNVDLIRYRYYGDDLLLLDLIHARSVEPIPEVHGEDDSSGGNAGKVKVTYKTISETIAELSGDLSELYQAVTGACQSLGEDVQVNTTKYYVAFKRLKNFACLEVHPSAKKVNLFLRLNPDDVDLHGGFTRDMRGIGHYGTGDLEITITTTADLERALPLIQASYEAS
ncbi:MAG: DUF5655 domain-containing protein [Planctomycetota bacterium]|jgi:predicted transport protein|nr:DUF5655 domain-containing protein [Planctomycetota bacterium]